MNAKQVVIGIMVLAASFLILVLVAVSVISYYPSIVGLDNLFPNDSISEENDKIIRKQKPVTITTEEFENYEKSISEKERIKRERDSLNKSVTQMMDSIRLVYERTADIRDSISKVTGLSGLLMNENKTLRDSLDRIAQNLNDSLNKLNQTRNQLNLTEESLTLKLDSLELKNYQEFAKIYNNSNPADVARILEKIEHKEAAQILKLMQARKAGKVIEQMKPENAAMMLLLGASK
ncbi:MAG: hypothetical protein KGZ71_06265 [Desulfobulbaceae bacterium]|nr:hypothetical protein [Candidatus Kapabacteria bacterium]MBS4000067.1 hypothetical protein [Desulfobulbaceae bacterium]